MKKLPYLTLALTLLFSSSSLSFAQTGNDFNTIEDAQTVELENDKTSAPRQNETTSTQEEQPKQEITQEPIQEQITAPEQSFWEILAAILIPSFFIILVYFILKTFKF
jgi:hypothetical protein